MKIEALSRAFDGLTTHQREEHLKTLIGQHIEIADSVVDIQSDGISLRKQYVCGGSYPEIGYWNIKLSCDKNKCGDDFLTYSQGDDVVLIAALKSGDVSHAWSLRLECVSIVRVRTYQSKLQGHSHAAGHDHAPEKDSPTIPYFLQALKEVNQANREFKPLKFWIACAKLPAAVVKSIVTLPFRVFKSITKK